VCLSSPRLVGVAGGEQLHTHPLRGVETRLRVQEPSGGVEDTSYGPVPLMEGRVWLGKPALRPPVHPLQGLLPHRAASWIRCHVVVSCHCQIND
jgi:hypothetical protein